MQDDKNTISSSPFVHVDPVIPPIFAGRSKEIGIITNALFSEKDSIVIYGNDAIGKSSIISTIYLNQIQNKKSGVFPVRINAFDFTQAIDNNFLGITTHQICASIWTSLLKKKYSELIEDSVLNKIEIFNTEEEIAIKRIFRIVTNEKNKTTAKYSSELGGKFIIEGKASSSNEFVNERKPLAPFEFLHLLDELLDMIRAFGYNSIMVFCDELNHFPEKTNTDILRNYFNIFSSQKIQFILVVVNPEIANKDDAQKLIESFNYKLEIGTFKSINDVAELIENSISSIRSELIFDKPSIEFLFEKTKGHPWWIQKICDKSFKTAAQKKINLIDLKIVELSFEDYKDEIKIYEEQIAKGLPFRKFLLGRKP